MNDLRKLPIEGLPPTSADQGDIEPSHLADVVGEKWAGDLEALVSKGWRFVGSADGRAKGAPVYVDEDERLKIGTDRLVARFEPNVSEDVVNATLHKYGLEPVRWLIRDKNVVQVRVPVANAGRCDVVEVGAALEKEPEVRYVQPELIEVFARR